jgi:hypothetical protein
MGELIQPGMLLVGGQQPGQLNQYYGFADANTTTVTAASYGNLSSQYVIPAGEADYAGAAYELSCGGRGTQGSTAELARFAFLLGGGQLAAATVPSSFAGTSVTFAWTATLKAVCADGVSSWWGSVAVEIDSATESYTGVASNSSAWTAAVSSAIPVALQAEWGATTGAPTITCSWTTWKKVA